MRYHFHVDDHVANNDVEGVEMASLEDAEQETCRLIGALLVENCRSFWRSPNWRIRVTDEAGTPVLAIMIMGVRGGIAEDPQ